jgi:hypothetical protein
MATYGRWVDREDVDLLAELDRSFRLLAAGFDERAIRDSELKSDKLRGR